MRALLGLAASAGARLVLAALYLDEDVVDEAVDAWEGGRSSTPPFVWRSASYEALQAATGRSRSRVAVDLARLRELGVIRRAARDGRRGLELLGVRGMANRGEQPMPEAAPRRPNVKVIRRAPSDPLTARLAALAAEIGAMFVPTDAEGRELGSRRVRADAATVERLRRLVFIEARADDAAIDRRVGEIRTYCRDYAALCRENGQQARCWGPAMLEERPSAPGRRSAWEVLTRLVDAWRAERAAAEHRRRVAAEREAQQQAERAAQLSAADVEARATVVLSRLRGTQIGLPAVLTRIAPPPPRGSPRGSSERPERTEAEEERIRQRGRQRETEAEHAAQREQHVQQRINAAFVDYSRAHGKTPPPAVADEIRRRIRAVEAPQKDRTA